MLVAFGKYKGYNKEKIIEIVLINKLYSDMA